MAAPITPSSRTKRGLHSSSSQACRLRPTLSEYAFNLICRIGVSREAVPDNLKSNKTATFVEETGLIRFLDDNAAVVGIHTSEELVEGEADFLVKSSFPELVQSLAPEILGASELLGNWSSNDLRLKYEQYLTWTVDSDSVVTIFSMVREDPSAYTKTALLVLTSLLERSLGDLYYHCVAAGPYNGSPVDNERVRDASVSEAEPALHRTKNAHINVNISNARTRPGLSEMGHSMEKRVAPTATPPKRLRDLLATAELKRCLGPGCTTTILCLMGPPHSLNLRNVVWHGFGNPDELPSAYVYFIISLLATIGQILHDNQMGGLSFAHRSFITYDNSLVCRLASTSLYKALVPETHAMAKVLGGKLSQFVPESMSCYLDVIGKLYERGKYGYASCTLVCLLEHCLRIKFCEANGCIERSVTTEVECHYITLDEILADRYGNEKNRLFEKLSASQAAALFDLLVYPEGLRLRNSLGHWEVSVQSLPEHVFGFLTACFGFVGEDQSQMSNPVFYEPLFYAMSLVCYRAQPILDKSDLLVGRLTTPDDGAWNSSTRAMQEKVDMFLNVIDTNQCASSADDCTDVRSTHVSVHASCEEDFTFFELAFCSKVSEKLRLLLQCTKSLEAVCDNIEQFHNLRALQVESKTLRSRQRKNYEHFTVAAPLLMLVVHGLAVSMVILCKVLKRKSIKRSLSVFKSILQLAENMNVLTQADRNKWSDCVQTVERFFHLYTCRPTRNDPLK